MSRFLRWSMVTVLSVAAGGCATMSVSSHVERGLDFKQYHTYAWGPADALPTGDPRLDENPFFKDHLQGEVEKDLHVRGLTLVTSGPSDLQIHYHANVTERLDVNRLDQPYGYCSSESCPGGVVEYEAGTIILDIVDVRTNRVIWRGWAQSHLQDLLKNQDRMAQRVNEAVTRMLRQLPPTL